MIIRALKITALRMAEFGECSPITLSARLLRIGSGKRGGNNGEIFRYIICDTESGERAARHQHLLTDICTTSINLVGLGVQIHHIVGLLAARVPEFIAATSACASAGASLKPSPVMATKAVLPPDIDGSAPAWLRRGFGKKNRPHRLRRTAAAVRRCYRQ